MLTNVLRKWFILPLVVIIAASLVLTGCSNSTTAASTSNPANAPAVTCIIRFIQNHRLEHGNTSEFGMG